MNISNAGDFLVPLLQELGACPVLVDIGASGGPPDIWKPIAPHAIYLGFDPDRRATSFENQYGFNRSIIHNRAVVDDPRQTEATVHLTRSPFCSSLLPPDFDSLSNYIFAEWFDVVGQQTIPTQTLDAALNELGLDGVDWFKTDTQGMDLRVFANLSSERANGVMVIDIEPGLIDAYQNEDLFTSAHEFLVRNGFWLAQLDLGRTTRLRPSSLRAPEFAELELQQPRDFILALNTAPGWCEARYLRTIDHMTTRDRRDWTLLWVFAVLSGQFGFAIDVYVDYRRRFGNDGIVRRMAEFLRALNRGFVQARKKTA